MIEIKVKINDKVIYTAENLRSGFKLFIQLNA